MCVCVHLYMAMMTSHGTEPTVIKKKRTRPDVSSEPVRDAYSGRLSSEQRPVIGFASARVCRIASMATIPSGCGDLSSKRENTDKQSVDK